MFKKNDEVIDLEVKRLFDDGIFIDFEKVYLEVEKIIIYIREKVKERKEKSKF